MGFEPTRPLRAAEFKSATTTNSVTRAFDPFSQRGPPLGNKHPPSLSARLGPLRIPGGPAVVLDYAGDLAVEWFDPRDHQLSDRVGVAAAGVRVVGVEALHPSLGSGHPTAGSRRSTSSDGL